MQFIPGMAQAGYRISGWLMSIADKLSMADIGDSCASVRICEYLLKTSYSRSGQRTR